MRFYQQKRSFLFIRKRKKKKEKRKRIIKNLTKLNSYFLFQKRYMYMIYKFQKSFKREFLYTLFFDQFDYANIEGYKKKLKIQQKTRMMQNSSFFLSIKRWNMGTRIALLSRIVQANLSGGISVTNNFFGKHF
jgi:hypothetical protein